MTFQTREEIRAAYQNDVTARSYWDRRFVAPIGRLLHHRQTQALRQIIASERPQRVLEIAPGPARLTTEVARLVRHGVFVDASAQMLETAATRLREAGTGPWSPVRGDAFALPIRGTWDLIYTFRFIRHFDAADRARLYAELHRLLRPGGWLVFDAVNAIVSKPLRERSPEAYEHYDALMDREGLLDELAAAGFRDVRLTGVQFHYAWLARLQVLLAPRAPAAAFAAMRVLESLPVGQPLEWIVTCRRS
jgi:SAM-dependent methyltransferase